MVPIDMNDVDNNSNIRGINKDKYLPPVPVKQDIEDGKQPTESDGITLLQAKSLGRKNFKKLSLRSNPLNDTNPDGYSMNLGYDNIHGTRIEDTEKTNKYETRSLRVRRELNLAKPELSGRLVLDGSQNDRPSTTNSSKTGPGSAINKLHLSTLNSELPIANRLSTLEIGSDKQIFNRRRQTVISSISPNKSTSSSPLELTKPPHSSNQSNYSEPISTLSITKNSSSPTNYSYSNSNHQQFSSRSTAPQQSNTIQTISMDKSLHSPNSITNSTSSITDIQDLMLLKDLGSGTSGTVSKVVHLPTKTIMAKKVIPIDLKNEVQNQIIRELRILHECRSPYIIEFFGAFINNNNIVICMEYCNCGSLDKIVPYCPSRQFPTFVIKKLAFSILTGLSYLYNSHKILHRDIKPSNVLMTHKGEFKLCDFGVSRQLTNSLTQADTFVGTSMYMSPERIQGMNYGIKSDVWSMGLLLIEMASGLPIWQSDNDEDGKAGTFQGPEGILDLLQRIVNENPPSLLKRINPYTKKPYDYDLCKFIQSCLEKKLSLRKAPDQLLADKNGFLKEVEEGVFDKDVRSWAKSIRKSHISKQTGGN